MFRPLPRGTFRRVTDLIGSEPLLDRSPTTTGGFDESIRSFSQEPCFVSAGVASAQGITDAQIANIVVTANQVDIDAGKLAAAKATNAEVKKFAQQMVTDHTGVNKQAIDLVTKLKVTPEDNATGKSLYDGGEKNVAKLKGLKGAEFDKAYIDHEVAYHTAVIDAVDKTLIPARRTPS